MKFFREHCSLIIEDEPIGFVQTTLGLAVQFAAAGLTQLGPHAGSTPSLAIAAVVVGMGIVFITRPLKRAAIDRRQNTVTLRKKWPWGYGRPKVIEADAISRIDVLLSRAEGTADGFTPRLILRSGRKHRLPMLGDSAENAVAIAREIAQELGLPEDIQSATR